MPPRVIRVMPNPFPNLCGFFVTQNHPKSFDHAERLCFAPRQVGLANPLMNATKSIAAPKYLPGFRARRGRFCEFPGVRPQRLDSIRAG